MAQENQGRENQDGQQSQDGQQNQAAPRKQEGDDASTRDLRGASGTNPEQQGQGGSIGGAGLTGGGRGAAYREQHTEGEQK